MRSFLVRSTSWWKSACASIMSVSPGASATVPSWIISARSSSIKRSIAMNIRIRSGSFGYVSARRSSPPLTLSIAISYASFSNAINSVLPPAASTLCATYASKARANISVGRVQYLASLLLLVANVSASLRYWDLDIRFLELPSRSCRSCSFISASFLIGLPLVRLSCFACSLATSPSIFIISADTSAFSMNITFIRSPIASTTFCGALSA